MKNILVLFSFLLLTWTFQAQTTKPNIIYILADDLGYGDISANNENGKINTPNIDKLASQGMRFTDAHTASSVCTPTRYSILTGRYNWRSRLKWGVLSGKSKALIPNSRTTVASLLKDKGYATAYIGKWHLGWDWALKNEGKVESDAALKNESESDDDDDWGGGYEKIDFTKPVKNNPNDLGFDYSYGHAGSLDMGPYVYVENKNVTEVPTLENKAQKGYAMQRSGPKAANFEIEQVTPHFFDKAMDYVKSKKDSKKPFFLYFPLPSPHTPILPTKEWQGKSGLNPYGDFVMMVDDYIGKLMKTLEENGLDKNTIVVFTSDNGCSNSANFKVLEEKGHFPSYIYRGQKATIYEGGHRVPFIVRWPGVVKPGIVSNETICSTDFFATCAEIVGHKLKDNEGEDSYSILPVLKQKNLQSPLREATVHHSSKGIFAIRKGDWKLVLNSFVFAKEVKDQKVLNPIKYELYNLKKDPAEKNNVANQEKETVKELHALLANYISKGRSTPGKDQKNDPIDFEWKSIQSIVKNSN